MKKEEKLEKIEEMSLVEKLMWQRPSQGPPLLPVFMNIRWPWKDEEPIKTWLGHVYEPPPLGKHGEVTDIPFFPPD